MKKSNSKFDKLVKKMETLNETEKGKLKGGITVLNGVQNRASALDATNYGICTGTGGDDTNYGICIAD